MLLLISSTLCSFSALITPSTSLFATAAAVMPAVANEAAPITVPISIGVEMKNHLCEILFFQTFPVRDMHFHTIHALGILM